MTRSSSSSPSSSRSRRNRSKSRGKARENSTSERTRKPTTNGICIQRHSIEQNSDTIPLCADQPGSFTASKKPLAQRPHSPTARSRGRSPSRSKFLQNNFTTGTVNYMPSPSISKHFKKLLCTRANAGRELKSINEDDFDTWDSFAAQYQQHQQYQDGAAQARRSDPQDPQKAHDIKGGGTLSIEQKIAVLEHQKNLLDLELQALCSSQSETGHNNFADPSAQSVFLQLSPCVSSKPLGGSDSQKLTASTRATGAASGSFNSVDYHERIIKQQQAEIEALRNQIANNLPLSIINTVPFVDDATSLTSAVYNRPDESSTQAGNTSNPSFVEEMGWTLGPPICQSGWYSGSVNNDMIPHGGGKIQFSNGDVYEGPFENGQMNGTGGLYVWASGDIYRGSFQCNLRHGHGEFRLTEIGRYVGNFEAGQQHGYGVQHNVDGSIYHKGQWESGQPSHEMIPFIEAEMHDERSFSSDQILMASDFYPSSREDTLTNRYETPSLWLEDRLVDNETKSSTEQRKEAVSSDGSIFYDDGITEDSAVPALSIYSSFEDFNNLVKHQTRKQLQEPNLPVSCSDNITKEWLENEPGTTGIYSSHQEHICAAKNSNLVVQDRVNLQGSPDSIPKARRTINKLSKQLAKLKTREEDSKDMKTAQKKRSPEHSREQSMRHF